MRLYYLGSRADFERDLREDWYSEWSIGDGDKVLLHAAGPPSASSAVVLEIPSALVRHCAHGPARHGEFLVPRDIVAAFVPGAAIRCRSGTVSFRARRGRSAMEPGRTPGGTAQPPRR